MRQIILDILGKYEDTNNGLVCGLYYLWFSKNKIRPIKVIGGKYYGTHGVSNFFYWKVIGEKKEYCGYNNGSHGEFVFMQNKKKAIKKSLEIKMEIMKPKKRVRIQIKNQICNCKKRIKNREKEIIEEKELLKVLSKRQKCKHDFKHIGSWLLTESVCTKCGFTDLV